MRLLLVATLVVRLVADIATPLLPGAFRLDADESVHVLGMRTARDAPAPCVRPIQPDRADDTRACRSSDVARRPRRDPPARPLPRAMAPRPRLAAPDSPSEDG